MSTEVENRTYCLDDVVDQLLGLVDLVLSIRHDETVQVFLLVAGMCCVRSAFTLLHGTFAANSDLGARFRLHLFERVSTRANE